MNIGGGQIRGPLSKFFVVKKYPLCIFQTLPSVSKITPDYTYFFYKQLVYKQPTLRWQIVRQLSGLNPFLLSNNKNYKLKKSGVFPL